MSANIPPFLEDNEINKRCLCVPGTFDIGKWFRTTEFAFYFKENENEFKIKEGDKFMYIKFHTDKKINFKQFRSSEKIEQYSKDILNAKKYRIPKLRDLNEYYSMMKNKKNILEEIKNNLI